MPSIHIPELFRGPLEKVATMSDEEFKQLCSMLESLKPHLKPEVLAIQANAITGTGDIGIALGEFVEALVSMNIAQLASNSPIDNFVRDVARSFPKRKDIHIDRAALEARLKTLLTIEPLALSARAFNVEHEYEHVFRSARIISDARPVFDQSGSNVLGAMVVHNLAISYVRNAEPKQILFALDHADLVELKKVLDRAEAKNNALEQLLIKADVRLFDSNS